MSRWNLDIDSAVLTSNYRWMKIALIQQLCDDDGSRPSAPCVKNRLIRLINANKVIGKIGRTGAAYFISKEKYDASESGRQRTPPMPAYGSSAATAATNFNRTVTEAINNEEIPPLPFRTSGSVTTRRGSQPGLGARTPRAAATSSQGPMQQEDFSVARFCERIRPTTVPTAVKNLFQREVSNILDNLGRNYRGYVEVEDVDEVIRELGDTIREKLLAKANQRRDDCPGMVEDEFLGREVTEGDPFLADILED